MLNYQRVNLPYIEHLGILLWAAACKIWTQEEVLRLFRNDGRILTQLGRRGSEERMGSADLLHPYGITGMIGDGNSAEIFLTFFTVPSGKHTRGLLWAIEIVDLPINSMVDLSIVMLTFTRPGNDLQTGRFFR